MPTNSDKYFIATPFYNIEINEAQRALIQNVLENAATTRTDLDADDLDELANLADMLKTKDENQQSGLVPHPVINGLCF